MSSLKQFIVFKDPYYWRTALLIAKSNLFKTYRNSYLGILWTLLQPLTMVAVYAVIMPIILHFPVQNYLLYVICTMPLWGLISSVLVGSAHSLLSQGETLKRCMISSTIFPVADTLRHIYTYLIAFLTMYCVSILLGYAPSWHILLLPLYQIPVMLSLMALAVGIAFVAPYLRDINEILLVLMNIMIWFSAVPYPISVVPEHLRWPFEWNPFYILLEPTILIVYQHTLPGPDVILKLCLITALSIATGYALYLRCRRNFVYYL